MIHGKCENNIYVPCLTLRNFVNYKWAVSFSRLSFFYMNDIVVTKIKGIVDFHVTEI